MNGRRARELRRPRSVPTERELDEMAIAIALERRRSLLKRKDLDLATSRELLVNSRARTYAPPSHCEPNRYIAARLLGLNDRRARRASRREA